MRSFCFQTVHDTNNPLESKLTYQSQRLVPNRSEDDKLANVTLAGIANVLI